MVRKTKQQWVHVEFIDNVRKLYPNKPFTRATKDLSKVLEEMLYGTQLKKK